MRRKRFGPNDRPVDDAADFVIEGEEPEHDEQQLVAWLSDSPRNVAEYVRTTALWEALADPRLEIEGAVEPHSGHRRAWWLAAAAVIAIALGTAGWWVATARPRTYSTAVGEVTSFTLPDRSVVFLNADSRISARYSETQRRIVVESGDALFDVAPDPERPFVVDCGSIRVTAVGTKFAVERRAGESTVTLIEGKVVVGASSATPADAPLPVTEIRRRPTATIALAPRQRLTVQDSGAATIATVDPQHVAPWRTRRLVFDSEPLAEVTAAFNRFNEPPLRVEGIALRNLRISGVFAANDPESLLDYLRTVEGVEVRVEQDGSATVRPRR